MTTTPNEPVEDPQVVPSGDPVIDPIGPDTPQEDPQTRPNVEPEPV